MKMTMHGIGSMKSPTMVKTATMQNMMRWGSLPATSVIQPDTTIGPRRYASIQPKAEAAPMVISGNE